MREGGLEPRVNIVTYPLPNTGTVRPTLSEKVPLPTDLIKRIPATDPNGITCQPYGTRYFAGNHKCNYDAEAK